HGEPAGAAGRGAQQIRRHPYPRAGGKARAGAGQNPGRFPRPPRSRFTAAAAAAAGPRADRGYRRRSARRPAARHDLAARALRLPQSFRAGTDRRRMVAVFRAAGPEPRRGRTATRRQNLCRRPLRPRLFHRRRRWRPPLLAVPARALPARSGSRLVPARILRMTGIVDLAGRRAALETPASRSEPPRDSAPPAYAELMVTSNFSFLRSGSDPAELVSAAVANGLAGLGLCDRNTLAGVVRAYSALRQLRADAGTGNPRLG